MATRLETTLTTARAALELKLNSLKRAEKNATNKLIAELIRKDINELSHAINTLTEIK